MLLIQEYKDLLKPINKLATVMWTQEVMVCCNAKNPNQITSKLMNALEAEDYVSRKTEHKYWYGKIKGQPFKDFEEFYLIADKFPSTEEVLLSPLWLVLTTPSLNQKGILKIIKRLNIDLQNIIYKEQQYFSKLDIIELYGQHPVNVILTLLLFHLWGSANKNDVELFSIEELIISQIALLYGKHFVKTDGAEHLCKHLSRFFPNSPEKRFVEVSMPSSHTAGQLDKVTLPVSLAQITNKEQVKSFLNAHQQLKDFVCYHQDVDESFFWINSTCGGITQMAQFAQHLCSIPIRRRVEESLRILNERSLLRN